MNSTTFILSVACCIVVCKCSSIPSLKDKLLTYPILYSHDSATGYLSGEDRLFHDFGKNQVGSYTDQLNCGARGFDVRPKTNGQKLYFHHGKVIVEKDFSEAMKEVMDWIKNPKHVNQLVILFFQFCEGDRCAALAKEYLELLGMDKDKFIESCSDVQGLTVAQAIASHKQGDGGGLMAVFGSDASASNSCVQSNYDVTVQCRVGKEPDDSCAKNMYPEALKVPGTRLFDHLKQVTANPLPNNEGLFVSANAHFQYSEDEIGWGLDEGSSIIKDEAAFGTLKRVNEWIQEDEFPHINLLQVDSVCNGGKDIYKTLFHIDGDDLIPDDGTIQNKTPMPTASSFAPSFEVHILGLTLVFVHLLV